MLTGNHTGIWRVALTQAGLAPVAALITWVFDGIAAGQAVLYGVLVALAVSTVLVWRERQSVQHPEWDQHRLITLFIRTGVERLVLLVGLMFVGLAVLELAPLPLLVGLVLAQFAWLAAVSGHKKE
jgi:ATP synthase protein I